MNVARLRTAGGGSMYLSSELRTELERVSGWEIPEHDVLGYLVRKLPLNTEFGSDTDNSPDGLWYAKLTNGIVTSNDQAGNLEFADSPEDAACKLLVELIKQGILKGERDG